MRRSMATLIGITLLAAAPLAVQAKDKDFAISIGGPGYSFTYVDPGFSTYYHRPAPVYVRPAPVYYVPRPVYYSSRPVYVAPYWNYRYGHRHYDRHDNRYRR